MEGITSVLARVKDNKGTVVAAVAALWVANKIRQLANAKHCCKGPGKERKHDPAQFPQYMPNADGIWLHTRQWPVSSPRGLVFLSHGFGEHIGRSLAGCFVRTDSSNRYEHVARFLNSRGYS